MAEVHIISVVSKLCPRVRHGHSVDLDDLADDVAEQSGFDRGDARDFAFKFARALVNRLKYGDYVKLGELGNFYVSCDKDGKLRVSYRAAGVVRGELARDFRGEIVNSANVGLDDEGFAQRWLALHPEDTVMMRDGSTRRVA